jgi:hypothetical protein
LRREWRSPAIYAVKVFTQCWSRRQNIFKIIQNKPKLTSDWDFWFKGKTFNNHSSRAHTSLIDFNRTYCLSVCDVIVISEWEDYLWLMILFVLLIWFNWGLVKTSIWSRLKQFDNWR